MSQTSSTGMRFGRARGAASADVDGELVLVSPVDRRCFALNGSAAAVWDALPGALEPDVTLDQIIEAISARFEVTGDTVEADVRNLLNRMVDAGVVTESE